MDGFTGLNIEKSKQQIDEFGEKAKAAYDYIHTMIINFFDELRNNWGSPDAVDFSVKYTKSLDTLEREYKYSVRNVITGAINAGEILCKANGVSNSGFSDCGSEGFIGGEPLSILSTHLNSTVDGVTGMYVERVSGICAIFAKEKKVEAISLIEAIPTQIDFYSADGSLMSAYKTGIESFVSQFSDEFDSMLSEIKDNVDNVGITLLNVTEEAEKLL